MYEAIKNFSNQFLFEPIVENKEKVGQYTCFVVLGMGGSALSAGLIKVGRSDFPIIIHRDYGLPDFSKGALVVASSYSGNTEEVLDGYDLARSKNLNLCAIAAGGKLLEKAKADGVPYIQIPDTGIQPRMAVGYSFLALAKFIGADDLIKEAQGLGRLLDPVLKEAVGKELAEKIAPRVPVIYASRRNEALAYNWKIMFNETGKIPAFYNVFPELNHNEINSFDVHPRSHDFHFLLFRDLGDHPRIQKRMEVLQKLFSDRGLAVDIIEITGANSTEKIFNNFLLGAWIAYYTAIHYKADPNIVPIVEEFKKLL